MLNAVFDAESLKEDNEVSEVVDEVVIAFVGFDVAQEDYVIRKIEHAFCIGQNNNCGEECRIVKCRIVRGEANAIAVLLVGQSGRLSAEFVGEIFLYFGECISQTLVGGLGLLCRRFNLFFLMVCLVAKGGFHTREELIEIVGCFHFLLDLGFVSFCESGKPISELSSLIFSSRGCFWSRARRFLASQALSR